MKKAMKALVAATVIGLFLAAVWVTTGIHFETNDDRYITEILSGTMFGHSDAHVIFINYLLALPLSLLYRLSVQIPWYGGMLILFHALSYCLFLRSLYDRCRSFFEMGAATAAVCCCMLVNICMTAEIQFTSTAVLMAVSGYAVLLLQRNEKMGVCLFFVMELLAYFLRSHAMLMIQPLGGVVYLLLCLMENRENLRSGWIRIAKWLAVIVSIFVIGLCGTAIGYHGREWAEYNRFNKVRSELLDYYGMPEYGEVQDILDRYGVTETEYTAFCRYVIIDREVPAECLEEIAEYMETQHPLAVHADEIRQNLLEIWRNNRFMEVCVLFALGYLLLRRRWGLLLPFGGGADGIYSTSDLSVCAGENAAKSAAPAYDGSSFSFHCSSVSGSFRKSYRKKDGMSVIAAVSVALLVLCKRRKAAMAPGDDGGRISGCVHRRITGSPCLLRRTSGVFLSVGCMELLLLQRKCTADGYLWSEKLCC